MFWPIFYFPCIAIFPSGLIDKNPTSRSGNEYRVCIGQVTVLKFTDGMAPFHDWIVKRYSGQLLSLSNVFMNYPVVL